MPPRRLRQEAAASLALARLWTAAVVVCAFGWLWTVAWALWFVFVLRLWMVLGLRVRARRLRRRVVLRRPWYRRLAPCREAVESLSEGTDVQSRPED